MTSIKWKTSAEQAFDLAQTKNKPVLLDFHNPNCIGCQQMDTVTYPKPNVIHFIDNHLIPLRFNVQGNIEPQSFRHIWTPTAAILTPKNNEVQRTIGFLGPEEFIATMQLGIAKMRLDIQEYDTALIPLKSLIETFPGNSRIPEAIFYSGVVGFKKTNNPNKLKEAYEKLLRKYPHDIWTKRAYPYDLI